MGKVKSNDRKGRDVYYRKIDVPFNKRMECFYCGCIPNDWDHVPPVTRYHDYIAIYDKHPPLKVPCCSECNGLLHNTLQPDLYQRFAELKVKLTKKIGKYVRMGNLWTPEDIEYGEYTGNLFKSLAAIENMAKICQERLAYDHWNISLGGENIERVEDWMELKVNGKKFSSMNHVFEHINKVHKIPVKYFEAVINIVGIKNLDYAFNLCKAVPVKSEARMKEVLIELEDDWKEQNQQ